MLAQAQSLSKTTTVVAPDDYLIVIPEFYRVGDVAIATYEASYDREDKQNVVSLYDSDFSCIKTINCPNGIYEVIIIDADQDAGYNNYSDPMPFVTQTLFNDDEKYEYLAPIKTEYVNHEYHETGSQGQDTIVVYTKRVSHGLQVCSEDGSTLATILNDDNDYSYRALGIIHLPCEDSDNGKSYLCVKRHDEKGGDIFDIYSIQPQTSSVKYVTSKKVASPSKYYDISGRKLSQPTKGINIVQMTDGTAKKIINK